MKQSSNGLPRRVRMQWMVGLATLGLAGCGESLESPVSEAGAREPVLTYEAFRAQAWREPDTGIYIVDGDTPVVDEAGLRALYQDYVRGADGEAVGTERAPLIVNRFNGADDQWGYTRQRNIPYCVSTAFGANYNTVVQAMAQAAAAWQQVNVRFQHRGDQDGACNATNNNVVFDVRPVSGQPYLARAFFPYQARATRNVLIDATSFGNTAPWTLTGILRHELGHTLGFRHEHTRPEARTCFEDNNWRALTAYDAASVMHYPQCNGSNRGDLSLTATDVAGAHAAYGPLADASFDTAFYLNNHGDLRNAFGATNWAAAQSHWATGGIHEGRRGAAHFDAPYYLAVHPDLQAAFGPTNYAAARDHWLTAGIAEGRRGSREFDVRYYLDAHPDLRAAFGTNYGAALSHWLNAGLYEGRRASPEFDVGYYLRAHADLMAAFGATNYPAAMDHWIFAGRHEGRRGAP
ncbi:M57 family metalloprotease [Pyxidicoccus xibeiensis]|uniref:M57 family metalloprotease n=1 Tax=Pyxidicoccus xibeiensis TaxID=2906759 RepID=UPI0020A814BD|nr:M57 family metalloprotease [Pyxidicoccus xibeiensis]MCP3139890.1 M57 family metalloprotease [Pyxidicoccus xibeiensis]